MTNHIVKNMQYFINQYKFILQKSDEALTIETKGLQLQAYSLYKSLIVDIDNLLSLSISLESNNTVTEEISKKRKNLISLRNNMCDCLGRMRFGHLSNADLIAAELIYSIQSECQYTKISSDGKFNLPSYPGSLEIYRFPASSEEEKGFIVISDWVGGLRYNVTPVLITPKGVLMFLDADNGDGYKVAVTLPYQISAEEFQRCVSVLSVLALVVIDVETLSDTQSNEVEQKIIKSTGETISNGVNQFSQVLSTGVVSGATKLGEFVWKGSDKLCQHVSSRPVELNPNIKTGLEYARTGTHKMIQISGQAFGILARATQYLASKAAPHIVATANDWIPEKWKEKGENGEISKVDQIALVTGSSLQGLSLLIDSLHEGAITFGRNVARSSGKVMRHCYGEDAGQSTENALYAAGNIGMTAIVASQFTKKGILKTAAKLTAIEVTEKYRKEIDKEETKNCLEKQNSISKDGKHI